MSRSFKKNKISKDPGNSLGKKISSRIFRRSTKTKLLNNTDFENIDLILPIDQSEALNSYSVVDFKHRYDKDEFLKCKK